MRLFLCFALAFGCFGTIHAQQVEIPERDVIISAMARFINTPVQDFQDVETILSQAGFVESGQDQSSVWFWQNPGITPVVKLDFDRVAKAAIYGEILGPVWYWRLGFRGITFDVSEDASTISLCALVVPSDYVPDIIDEISKAGYRFGMVKTKRTSGYDTDGSTRVLLRMNADREEDEISFGLWMIGNYAVFKLFL